MALVPDQLRFAVADEPDRIAYRVLGAGDLTYAEWERGANRFAHALVDAGVARGDRVALLIEPADAIHHLQAYMGTHKAGAAAVPTNVRLTSAEIAKILAHAEPALIVCSAPLLATLKNAVAQLPISPLFVVVGGDGPTGWEQFLSDDDRDTQASIGDDDIADILYTSGTTGLPKGVVARHRLATTMNVEAPASYMDSWWLHASPFFTFAGTTFITIPMRMGMPGAYMPRFDAGEWLDFVEREPVLMTFLVPAMVELLLNHQEFATRDLSGVMMASVGSAPVSPASLARLQEKMVDAAISNSYSMTELGAAYCLLPRGELEKRPGSVGIPVAPTRVRIVNDDREEVSADTIGDIEVSNPGREREYYNDPEATASTWEGGWLRTGDIGKLDADGYLYILDRKKDVIIRGGNNIYAAEVESALYEHPSILECAVVGMPHEVLGEDVCAFIVTNDPDLTGEAVSDWCSERLADYKRPRRVEFVDELPRNPMGKVLKNALRSALTSQA